MPHSTGSRLLVMHALRVRGLSETAALANATAQREAAVDDIVRQLATDGLAMRREGRVSGWALLADGKAQHGLLLAEDRAAADADAAVEIAYKGFLDLNGRFKELCTDWQLRTIGGEQVLNDHTDADYDAAIATRLSALHADVLPLVDDLADVLDRFRPYSCRLEAALSRFVGGDAGALARPLSGSYHDVWMELHQDLLLTLGRERADADGH